MRQEGLRLLGFIGILCWQFFACLQAFAQINITQNSSVNNPVSVMTYSADTTVSTTSNFWYLVADSAGEVSTLGSGTASTWFYNFTPINFNHAIFAGSSANVTSSDLITLTVSFIPSTTATSGQQYALVLSALSPAAATTAYPIGLTNVGNDCLNTPNGSGCLLQNIPTTGSNLIYPAFAAAVNYTANSSVTVQFYPGAICYMGQYFPTNTSLPSGLTSPASPSLSPLCSGNTAVSAPVSGSSSSINMQIQFSVWPYTSGNPGTLGAASSGSSGSTTTSSGAVDTATVNFYFTNYGPSSVACPTYTGNITLADSAVNIAASNMLSQINSGISAASTNAPIAQIWAIAKLAEDPVFPTALSSSTVTSPVESSDSAFLSTLSSTNDVAVVGGQSQSPLQVTPLQDTTSANNSYSYYLQLLMQDQAGGITLPSASSCVLGPIQVSEVHGFLSGSKCFIATAAHGDPQNWGVQVLRKLRDDVLQTFLLGQKFINAYEHYSPSWADWLDKHAHFKGLVLLLLWPIELIAWVFLKVWHSGSLAAALAFFVFGIGMTGFGLRKIRRKKRLHRS